MDANDIINRFRHHPPTSSDTVRAHEKVRSLCLEAALELNTLLTDSREKSLAVTALQEVMMWANAAIACNSASSSVVTSLDGERLYQETVNTVHHRMRNHPGPSTSLS